MDWKPQGSAHDGVPVTYVAHVDSGSVSLLWMDSSILKYRYVPGFKVPERGPVTAADHSPSTWLPRAAASFNGGFQIADRRGGYYYDKQTVSPLQAGLGTFVVTGDGTLKVGKWGRDLHMSADTVVVRQNMPLLVDNSRDQTSAQDASSTWGAADGGSATVNRSAVGQLPDGAVVFAFGSSVTASAMAKALVDVGVSNAMVLDMNRSWPTGFTYTHSHGSTTGEKIHPAIVRPATSYNQQFEKDFVMAELP